MSAPIGTAPVATVQPRMPGAPRNALPPGACDSQDRKSVV